MGQKSGYTPELGEKIATALAEHTGGLRSLCKANDDFPAPSTVLLWVQQYPEFAEHYSRARESQLLLMAEDIADILDDEELEPNDKRIRVNGRQWLLSKLMHRTYGDKLDVTSGGEAIGPAPHMIDARVQSIIMQARARRLGHEPLPPLDDNALKLLD